MINEYGIAPCPFCESLFTYVSSNDEVTEHVVKCNNCGAIGPTSTWGREDAIKRWNWATREQEPDEESAHD